MPETLVTILTAHLLGDFVFQTGRMVKRKRHMGVLLLHVIMVTVLSCLLIGCFHWQILLLIFLTHLALDALKVYRMEDSLVPFLIDQGIHLAVLICLACLFPDAARSGWWATGLNKGLSEWYFACLSLLSGLVLILPAGGVLIGKATSPFRKEINEDMDPMMPAA